MNDTYYTCPSCGHGFDEKPRHGYCWACKVPIDGATEAEAAVAIVADERSLPPHEPLGE